jgi:EAL domain-containing protein (putative c-di-GMP-specific phosphodiesterase class I)
VFVEDLARMIKDAGYKLVAEGIESEALLQRVTELGFSHAQGFHIGRPAARVADERVSRSQAKSAEVAI